MPALTLGLISICALAIAIALFFLGQYTFWLPRPSWKIPRVLMYHSVSDAEPSGMNISPAKLARQLGYLQQKKFQFVFVSELGPNTPFRTVAITFDDGFANNYSELFPLLKQYNVKATIYLAPMIKDIEFLNTDQIREMQASGLVEFGAHTLRHVNLTCLNSEQAKAEIVGSKQSIEALTGTTCRSFSYPYGRFNSKNITQVQTAGFENAVTVKKRPRIITDKDFVIPRIGINGKANQLQFRIALGRGRYRL